MAPIDSVPRAGEVVAGKYILRERLGEGGMGLVYLAEQISLERAVAIKVLQPALIANDAVVRQFHTEAVAACRVKHPGTVGIIDCGTTAGGLPFIVMERAPGRLLSEVIADSELPLPRVLGIMLQLLRTLKVVHAQRVIHADVKSDNVMLDDTAEGDAVTLIDFGLARVDGRWGPTDVVSGTPEYMAPELVRGEPPTVATDVYGVGVILYELLTGRTPFAGGSTEEILRRQLEDAVVPPSLRRPDRGIPVILDEIVVRALDKDPRARFASAAELDRTLAAVRRPPARRPGAAVAGEVPAPSGSVDQPPPPATAARRATLPWTGLRPQHRPER